MAKTEIDDVSLDHLFVGIGRLNGDDDDTMHTIEAKDLADASRIFERYMRESVQDFESEVCISEILSLENAIKARVSDSDINQHLDRDDVPDVSVVYERQPSPNSFRMVAPK